MFVLKFQRLCSGVKERIMAKISVDKGFFSSHAEVMADIAKTGYWPTTYISEPSPELPLHQHGEDIIGYLLEGHSYVLGEGGERTELEPGDRLVLPFLYFC